MQVNSRQFRQRAAINLADARLQRALLRLQEKFVRGRTAAIAEIDNFEALRDAGTAIRDRTLTDLDLYLERFEERVIAAGGSVHWAQDAAQAQDILIDIARQYGVQRVVKSKSMVTEECNINEALAGAGIKVVETDLGEYILQLAHEPPSHIVAPVVHKSKEEIAELFHTHHNAPRKSDIAELCREAREVLRPGFLSADMGISGANFLVAETGSVVILTNEGNGRLVTTLPPVHVAITGIEKVVPTLADLVVLLRLLPRSATGQPITNYVSLLTGVRASDEHDGPQHFHVILVDNGRSRLLAGDNRSMLRCIRCGACMNHCPVYQSVGGHAYGSVYPGPMGAVLTPAFAGLAASSDLPNASTFCGACAAVCPVKIPLPDLMRNLRERELVERLRPLRERLMLRLWIWTASHPRVYHAVTRLVVRALHRLAGREGLLHHLPGAAGWTKLRDLPAPAGDTFHALYQRLGRHEQP